MDVWPRCSQDLSMQEWTKAKLLKFLKLYSSERVLWDVSHKHNKIKRKVHEAWKRISANMDNTQIAELKKRKKNLMTRYRSLVKKRETDYEAGYDEEICQPVWYAFELMDSFLGSTNHEDPLKIESEIQLKTKKQTDLGDKKPKKEIDIEKNLGLKSNNSDNESEKTNESSHNDISNNFRLSNNIYENEDECELYTRLLAKKLRRYPVDTRHRLMYTIDGLLLDNPYPKDRLSN